MIYDFITIWGGASGLFSNIFLPKKASKLLLEKNKTLWVKVLMSWWERANFTNMYTDPSNYVSNNPKAIIGFLKRFSQYDTINFFEQHGVSWKVEDNGRVITASGHARDIVKVLINKAKSNNTIIYTQYAVEDVEYKNNMYVVKWKNFTFYTKNLIIAVWWKSYPQVWTDGFGFELAKKFGLKVYKPYKWLVWVVTKEKLSDFAGTTIEAKVSLFYKNKENFSQIGNVLFTHWWLSWPTIYNAVLYWPDLDENPQDYKIKIQFLLKDGKIQATKRLKKAFNLSENNLEIEFNINSLKSWKEAKVTAWGVHTNELTKFLESKKFPGLFFIGEVVDITGHTWWFNLQWAWSSGYCMAEKFRVIGIQ